MGYRDITFGDPNVIKRWLQSSRLRTALQLATKYAPSAKSFCDYGGGNGELCVLLNEAIAASRITCFEPAPQLIAEARTHLEFIDTVQIVQSIQELTSESFDVVFCLEVFEHLPEIEGTSKNPP